MSSRMISGPALPAPLAFSRNSSSFAPLGIVGMSSMRTRRATLSMLSSSLISWAASATWRASGATVLQILKHADAIYQSEGKAGRLIFRKGNDIVVVEGPGSGQGSVITGYGPSGIKGDSGAAALAVLLATLARQSRMR